MNPASVPDAVCGRVWKLSTRGDCLWHPSNTVGEVQYLNEVSLIVTVDFTADSKVHHCEVSRLVEPQVTLVLIQDVASEDSARIVVIDSLAIGEPEK